LSALSVHGSANQPISVAAFVKHILRRAEKEGDVVYTKVLGIVREEGARGPLRLEGFEKDVVSRFIRVAS
jgi:hypothetical protein